MLKKRAMTWQKSCCFVDNNNNNHPSLVAGQESCGAECTILERGYAQQNV